MRESNSRNANNTRDGSNSSGPTTVRTSGTKETPATLGMPAVFVEIRKKLARPAKNWSKRQY